MYTNVRNGGGNAEEELALAGVETLADFILENGLPTSLREPGLKDRNCLKEIANSCNMAPGSYKKCRTKKFIKFFVNAKEGM